MTMTLTQHPVRLFRLSCGCLRGYPIMTACAGHPVLCITCRVPVLTVDAYPARCCGVTGWADISGTRLKVACTLPRRTCNGCHFDAIAGTGFTLEPPRLERSREGKTGRA
jgi:hypothetical protein